MLAYEFGSRKDRALVAGTLIYRRERTSPVERIMSPNAIPAIEPMATGMRIDPRLGARACPTQFVPGAHAAIARLGC